MKKPENKKDLAERIGVCERTLYNWEDEKPELIYLINLGLMMEEHLSEEKRHIEALEALHLSARSKKKIKLWKK